MFSRLNDSTWFASRRKLPLQVAYLVLVLLAMILTGVRISNLNNRVARSDTLAIVMGVKSIVLMSYQLSTTYVSKLLRWKSRKAYMIIDYMEIVFWFVVMILAFMGVSRFCAGVACGLGVAVGLIAILLSAWAAWLAIIATLDHRHFKSTGADRGTMGNYK